MHTLTNIWQARSKTPKPLGCQVVSQKWNTEHNREEISSKLFNQPKISAYTSNSTIAMELTVIKLEAKKLQMRSAQPWCLTASAPSEWYSATSLFSGPSGNSASSLSSPSSSFNCLYPARRRTVVSGGGRWWRTEISWAVAVPDGNASCSLIIYLGWI